MKRHYLSSAAAIALAFGVTAAAAQNVDQRRNADQGKQADQLQRNQQSSAPDQSQNMPSPRERSDQGQGAPNSAQNQQGAQNQERTPNRQEPAPQQDAPANPPATTGQNDRPQSDRQDQPADEHQGAQHQNVPTTSGQSRQGAQEPQSGQNKQSQQPSQPQNQDQGAGAPRPGQRQQDAQSPRPGTDRPGTDSQQGAENAQRHSGRILLGERDRTRIDSFVQQQRIQPVTNINFSLSVATTVPSSVRLSKISGELADIFPNYRDFDFFVAQQELVIVDPGSFAIVAFVPMSGRDTVGAAAPRENTEAASTAPRENAGTTAPVEPPAKRKTTRKGDTTRRHPAHTETDVTVGVSRRDDIEEFDPPAPPDRPVGPPIRRRIERDPGPPPFRGPPFPFSLFFGR